MYKSWCPTGLCAGTIAVSYIYINDFLSAINKLASTVLFADDTSIILSNMNPDEFMNITIQVMNEIIEWFQSNLLSLNFNKTTFIQFITKKKQGNSISNYEFKLHNYKHK